MMNGIVLSKDPLSVPTKNVGLTPTEKKQALDFLRKHVGQAEPCTVIAGSRPPYEYFGIRYNQNDSDRIYIPLLATWGVQHLTGYNPPKKGEVFSRRFTNNFAYKTHDGVVWFVAGYIFPESIKDDNSEFHCGANVILIRTDNLSIFEPSTRFRKLQINAG